MISKDFSWKLPLLDVLAAGMPEQVYLDTLTMRKENADHSRIIWSYGDGILHNVPTENLLAFIKAVMEFY